MAERNDQPRPEDLDAAKAADARDRAGAGSGGEESSEWDISDADVDAINEGIRAGSGSTGFAGGSDLARLRQELAEERSRNLRLMADYQNFQRRAASNEVVARQMGVSSVVSSIATVLDHFDIALSQTSTKTDPQQIIDGVKLIREELVRSLNKHGVHVEAPGMNSLFIPGKHEAIMQQAADGVDPGHVVTTFQAGFILREGEVERVIRPAKVSVAP
ncbi:MAG: nucleotide exchange factor GrpE [Phycisphaerales bacterium]